MFWYDCRRIQYTPSPSIEIILPVKLFVLFGYPLLRGVNIGNLPLHAFFLVMLHKCFTLISHNYPVSCITFISCISISTGSWLVLVHKVLLLTSSDLFTFMILRRHLLTNVCILFTVCLVILHVSELYNRTDLTLELNILILVFSLISFDFQILLIMRKATRAFWIRALVSSSVPPILLILLPRYVKQSVSSSGFPPTVTTFLLFVLAFIILVLFILMLMLVCADTRFSRSVLSCICSWLCDRRARSSSSWLQRVHWIPFLLFVCGRFHYPVYGHQESERW